MAMNGKKSGKKALKESPKSQRYQNIKENSKLLKEAKEKAHHIVLSLLDVKINKEYLAENIVYLTQENFDDVVIERSLIGVCGYTLCDQPLTDQKFKNQTYIIRNNKVYDVTKRKNFCSNKCYQAFEMLHHQIPTTPLYVRAEDKDIQNLEVVVPVLEDLKGKFGKRVNITGMSFDFDVDLEDDEESSKTPASDRSSPDLSEEDHHETCTNQSNKACLKKDQKDFSVKNSLHLEEEHLEKEKIMNILNQSSERLKNTTIEKGSNDNLVLVNSETKLLNDVENLSLDPGKKEPKEKNEKSSNVDQNKSANASQTLDILEVERVLREWMSFESLLIILGDVYVRGMLEHFGEVWEHYDRSSDMQFPRLDMKAKFITLCKKLNRQEMSERLEETQVSVEEEDLPDRESLKPMPDYERLKKDVQQSSHKVKAFYEGTEEFISNKEVLEVIKEETGEDDTEEPSFKKRAKKSTKPKENEEDRAITLPLIDQYSQKSWRRQIVFEKLCKRLAEFAVDFVLDEREVRKLVIPLIETFDLTAQNINFKMSQWKFVALVIIKMLSVRYPIIAKVFLPTEKTFSMIATYLRTMGLDEHYLDRLLSYLTDVAYILAKTEKVVSLESDYDENSSRGTKSEEKLLLQNAKSINLNSNLPVTDYEQLD